MTFNEFWEKLESENPKIVGSESTKKIIREAFFAGVDRGLFESQEVAADLLDAHYKSHPL